MALPPLAHTLAATAMRDHGHCLQPQAGGKRRERLSGKVGELRARLN